MLKINKMAYYALKGMLAENAKSLELIISRIGFMASTNPGLGEALVNGIAIDVKIKNPDALRKYLRGEKITEMKVSIKTYSGLEQSIKIMYLENDKKLTRELYISSLTSEEQSMFEIEYV